MADPDKHLSRADYVKNAAKFWYDGDEQIPVSQWVVRRVKHEKNVFTCVRVIPKECAGPNIDDFEIGFVLSQVRGEEENLRTIGPRF